MDETFDQIGLFFRKKGLPPHLQQVRMGLDPQAGPDYGMFNFVELFSQALRGRPFAGEKKEEAARKEDAAFLARFEHTLSDHMPIWIRIPLFDAPLLGKDPKGP
jgi:hypothetical protein